MKKLHLSLISKTDKTDLWYKLEKKTPVFPDTCPKNPYLSKYSPEPHRDIQQISSQKWYSDMFVNEYKQIFNQIRTVNIEG